MATLQAAPTRHHHTEQFSGILTWPWTKEGGRFGKKHSAKMASKKPTYCVNSLRRTASNYLYKSQGAPARGIGPPPPQHNWENCSIASRLTLLAKWDCKIIFSVKDVFQGDKWGNLPQFSLGTLVACHVSLEDLILNYTHLATSVLQNIVTEVLPCWQLESSEVFDCWL